MNKYLLTLLQLILTYAFTFGQSAPETSILKGYEYKADYCISGNCDNGKGVTSYYTIGENRGSYDDPIVLVVIYYFEGDFENKKMTKGKIYLQDIICKPNKDYARNGGWATKLNPTKDKVLSFEKLKQEQQPFYEGEVIYNTVKDVKLNGKGKLIGAYDILEGTFVNDYFVEGKITNREASGFSCEGNFTPNPTYYKKDSKLLPHQVYHEKNITPYLISGKVIYFNGDVFWGGTIANYRKNGVGLFYEKQKNNYTSGFWNYDEQIKDAPEIKPTITLKDTVVKTIAYTVNDDVNSSSNKNAKYIYTGTLQNGKPHGWGTLQNQNFKEVGVTYYYAGYFKDGKKEGPGNGLINGKFTSAYYINDTPNFISETSSDSLQYIGFVKDGKYNGKGELKVKRTDKDKRNTDNEVWKGTFVNGEFTGNNYKQGFRGKQIWEEDGYYKNGKLIEGGISYSITGLWQGAVINYQGKKAVVAKKGSSGVDTYAILNTGETVYGGFWQVFKENASSFKEPCAKCKGTGQGPSTQKVIGYANPTNTLSHTNATTIRGGYTTITTTYNPIYETIKNTCEICNGTGATYKTAVQNVGNSQYQGAAEIKKEKTALEAYNDGLQSLKYGGQAIALFAFMEAGNKGHPMGAFYSGYMIENKKGMTYPDATEKAIEWYKKAAALGNEDAKKALTRLNLKP